MSETTGIVTSCASAFNQKTVCKGVENLNFICLGLGVVISGTKPKIGNNIDSMVTILGSRR